MGLFSWISRSVFELALALIFLWVIGTVFG